MRHALSLSLALGCAATLAAACSGGGGSTSAANALPPGTPPIQNFASNVSITIKIPQAPTASAASRKPGYVSPGTQSIGVVVTDQGATPSAAQFTNVSSCPQVSGVTSCTITVQALAGSDAFAITAYSAPNGGGSVLSTGSITASIVAGQANTTLPVTLGGVAASISITPAIATLPLGQSTTLNVVAKDASGAAIVGTFNTPIALSGSNLTFSSSSLTNSNDASKVTVAWNYGFAGSGASTITASGDGATGSVALPPGTGIAYYQTGSNSTTDVSGFKMIAGSDGKLYYTSIGAYVCATNGLCQASSGAVHQFDPVTGQDTEVALQSEGVGLLFTSDGALWVAGGPPATTGAAPLIYRMAPGQFSSGAVAAIPIPTASPNHAISVRSFAQDASGNLWFAGNGFRIAKMPVAGPYQSSSITEYAMPRGPSGTTPGYNANIRNMMFAGGTLMAMDSFNSVIDVVNTSTGATTGQYVTNLQKSLASSIDSADPYDASVDATSAYISQLGNWDAAQPVGDIEQFSPATNTFTTLPLVSGPVTVQAGASSVSGSLLYVQDFGNTGLQLVNLTSQKARLVPLAALDGSFSDFPNGVAAMSDGSAWFTCYGGITATGQPICVGHTIYLSGWSIFPSSSIALYGAGSQSAQIMGIMEAPNTDSGPFVETSSDTSICTVQNAADHNFTIVGVAPGACTVTVTDKNKVTSTINVTVTTTHGTVQAKHLGGIL